MFKTLITTLACSFLISHCGSSGGGSDNKLPNGEQNFQVSCEQVWQLMRENLKFKLTHYKITTLRDSSSEIEYEYQEVIENTETKLAYKTDPKEDYIVELEKDKYMQICGKPDENSSNSSTSDNDTSTDDIEYDYKEMKRNDTVITTPAGEFKTELWDIHSQYGSSFEETQEYVSTEHLYDLSKLGFNNVDAGSDKGLLIKSIKKNTNSENDYGNYTKIKELIQFQP